MPPEKPSAPPRANIPGWRTVFICATLAGVVIFVLGYIFLGRITGLTGQPIATALLAVLMLTLLSFTLVRYYTAILHAVQQLFSRKDRAYTHLLNSGNHAILTLPVATDGTFGKIIELNEIAVQRTGYPREELLTAHLDRLLAPDRQDDLRILTEDIRSQRQCRLETTFLASNGQRVPVDVFAQKFDDHDGESVRLFVRDISDPKRVEAALRESRATLRAFQDAAPLALVTLDGEKNVTNWSKAAETIFGWKEYEVFGNPLPCIPSDAQAAIDDLCTHLTPGETLTGYSTQFQRSDDSLIDVSLAMTYLPDTANEVAGLLLVIADITDQQRGEARLARISRTLELVSGTKRAMFCAVDEHELLQSFCSVMTQTGGYGLAWIGFANDDAERTIRPMEWAGEGNQDFASIAISSADKYSKDPVASAMCTGNVATAAAGSCTWISKASEQGFCKVIVLPLLSGLRPFGVLTLYSKALKEISGDEVELLSEIADDLACGLDALHARTERLQAQEELLEAAQEWRVTFDAIQDPICVVDAHGTVTRCNDAMAKLTGTPVEKLSGRPLSEILFHTAAMPDNCALPRVIRNHQPASETIAYADRWFSVQVDPVLDKDDHLLAAIHIMNDVTEERRAEDELKQNNGRLQDIVNETITTIATIVEMRDPYTAGHEQRVSQLACAIAQEMGLSEDRIEGLRVAGILHDVGKLYVPSEILSKTGKLTDAEFSVIKAHAQAGYDILCHINFPWPVAKMVQQHHERMNGTGYPLRLSGEDILLEARILGVADVVEAMATHRPYRPSRGIQAALDEIAQRAGDVYDQQVADACLRLFNEKRYSLDS